MKDAKGHGSNPRGTAPGYAGRDQMGRTYTQALRDHDRFPKQNPTLPNGEDYKTPGSGGGGGVTVINGQGKVARIAQAHGIQGGPFKVQTLNTKLAGTPFETKKSYRNNTVAEHVAKYMRTDGDYTRVKVR